MNYTSNRDTESGFGGLMCIDTTFVLFFLALEYGRSIQMFSIDAMLMGTTMLMVLVLPYFLPVGKQAASLRENATDRLAVCVPTPSFTNWLVGRGSIALFGMLLGLVFRQSVGVILPQSLRYVPMTLLILTAMISCYIQFYGLMKLRLAK